MSMKDSKGKTKLSLVPYYGMVAVAKVREYGVKKYGDPDGWKEVSPMEFIDAALRHIGKYLAESDYDEESGLHHISHAACNLMFVADMMQNNHEKVLSSLDREYARRLTTEEVLHILEEDEDFQDDRDAVFRKVQTVFNEEYDGGAGS